MKTQETFIKDAKKIHGDKYDYSKVVYKGIFEKVCIICPEHGEFWQTPHSHLNGRGCPECGKIRKKYKSTTEYFISRAQEKYGDEYDYKKTIYQDSKTPVCITCRRHGDFWISPHSHLDNSGCPICAKEKRQKGKKTKYTLEEFITKAKETHGEKYDYSKVKYVNNRTKVCIICPIHGEFWQTPSSHLSGRGCNLCAKPVYNTETFIEQARRVHGNKYDYSKVKYEGGNKKVCIICPIHGEFWQTPSNHLSKLKKGCYKCNRKAADEKKFLTTEEFIRRAKKIHGDEYDYSNCEYYGTKVSVAIGCKKHGIFFQIPNHHLHGEGCPLCQNSILERKVENMLIEHKIKFFEQQKFEWLGKQRLDFYLPEYNVAIECQGEQHYKPVDFAGKGKEWAKKSFENIKKLDRLKKDLCTQNGVKILYIKYNENDINKKLNKVLTYGKN